MNAPTFYPGSLTLARFATRAAIWIVRRPFLMRGSFQVAGGVTAFGGALSLATTVGPLYGLPLVILGLLLGMSRGYVAWLTRGDDPVVLLSRFKSPSVAGQDAAASHADALRRFLESDPSVTAAGPFMVRVLDVPLSDASARRLLRSPRVAAVIRGTGDATASVSQWDATAWYRAGSADVSLSRFELSIFSDRVGRVAGFFLRDRAARASRVAEGDLERDRFMATSISVRHFRDIAKVLLILLGEAFIARPGPKDPRVMLIPKNDDPVLDAGLRGRVLVLEAEARRGVEEPRSILNDIEGHGFALETHDESFAVWVTTQYYCGEIEGWTTPAETLASYDRWCAALPSSSTLALNRAGTLIRLGASDTDVTSAIEMARKLGAPRSLIHRFTGNLAWRQQDARTALKHYRRARLFRRSALRWQIGDCLAAMGRPRAALHEYRMALRRDSFRVPAAERARAVARWHRLQPTMTRDWRLRLWDLMHRRPHAAILILVAWRWARPEDPYLPTWLGRHSLILGDIRNAERWIYYATRFDGSNRLIAHLDLFIVDVLKEDPTARDALQFYDRHLSWLEAQGIPGPRHDASVALSHLLESSPAIRSQPQVDALVAMLAEIGVELESSPPR